MDICKHCKRPITWGNQKMQFGKMKGKKLSDEFIKENSKLCPTCFKILMKTIKKPTK